MTIYHTRMKEQCPVKSFTSFVFGGETWHPFLATRTRAWKQITPTCSEAITFFI